MEAAYNLMKIYQAAGQHHKALQLVKKYLTFD